MSCPQLLTWITCDAVYVDQFSGKHTLLGIFSSLRTKQFPVVHRRMVWFLSLTDVDVGMHELKISVGLQLEGMNEVIKRKFESKSPAHRLNLINEIQNLKFEKEGNYSIQIDIDDEMLLVVSLPVHL